ncbi:MAG: CDP-alcohol phosphatidyltransferase family protein [Bacteroidaceae bacterium]|nr:CDP-alcohol phosphatidyltransferase family protein [Bacteroidaceae bacterium]
MANRITRHIPNAITCCNLLCGCMAVMAAFNSDAWHTLLWVVAGSLFDFCDGMASRLLKAYSLIGKELDSLADLITFGLSPAILCLMTLRELCTPDDTMLRTLYPFIALILVVSAALRLAKFNTDERQTSSFLGLAVPANALFWCGLFQTDLNSLPAAPWIIGVLVLLFAGLMVSRIPMFSLKFKSLRWADNKVRFIFLIVSVVILALLREKGLSAVIGWYIILSILTKGQH